MQYCVYKHTSPNGKVYVGITCKKPEYRWKNGYGYRLNAHFYHAILKYGWDNFTHEILFTNLTQEEAEVEEIMLIAQYKSNQPEFGYNHASGGHGTNGWKHTNESRKKIAESLTGVHHSKMRKYHESIAKKKNWKNPEYKQRMVESHVGKSRGKNSTCSKLIGQFTLDGKLVGVYWGSGEAFRATGIRANGIRGCLCGSIKTCKGFVWKFL